MQRDENLLHVNNWQQIDPIQMRLEVFYTRWYGLLEVYPDRMLIRSSTWFVSNSSVLVNMSLIRGLCLKSWKCHQHKMELDCNKTMTQLKLCRICICIVKYVTMHILLLLWCRFLCLLSAYMQAYTSTRIIRYLVCTIAYYFHVPISYIIIR